MAYDSDAHITLPLNNHLNMINAIVSLIAPSVPSERKHIIAV